MSVDEYFVIVFCFYNYLVRVEQQTSICKIVVLLRYHRFKIRRKITLPLAGIIPVF